MSETLDPTLSALNDCGCCAGVSAETPADSRNREGLDQVRYRTGVHSQFKRTMLAALSEKRRPSLHGLTTRADDDFSIALLDAWAATLDVLTFYQERLANELFLRTATEHGSVLRLARLIGYELKPGVAASTWLAFQLETAPGAPEKAHIARGAKVQSVPGQDEKPQTFETIEPLDARAEWNAMRPQMVEPVSIHAGLTHLYFKGAATHLQPGDAILIVGDERELNPTVSPDKERWDFRIVIRVVVNAEKDWTYVEWEGGLGKATILPAAKNVRVYALRQRAALFGHNAPDRNLIHIEEDDSPVLKAKSIVDEIAIDDDLLTLATLGSKQWPNFEIRNGVIDLDASYAKIIPGSWLALARPPASATENGYVELYKALNVSFPSRSEFAISAKITRIYPDTVEHLAGNFFTLLNTIVYAQSERLELTSPPLTTRADEAASKPLDLDEGTLAPLEGTRLTLDRQVTVLAKGRTLIVTGKRIRAKVALNAPAMTLTDDTGAQSKQLHPGDTLVVLRPPALQSGDQVSWRLRHDDGFEGTLLTGLHDLALTIAAKTDVFTSEQVAVNSTEGNPTEFLLSGAGLQGIYDRATVTIAGNVALATHGETVEEYAGNGDATQAFQRFTLRQAPLTYVRAATPAGMASTLEVRIDDLLWREVPFLYQRGAEERVHVSRLGDEQNTTVHFGDGVTGARLPSGQQNVRFKYRKGSGIGGLVKAGQLTQLMARPLGVKEVINPLPAEGADEPESLSDARRNAPLTVLTLGRAVSLRDYQDFTQAYPGIAKALATWTLDGSSRGVLLTVAGPNGAAIESGGQVAGNLLKSLRAAGDPFVPVRVATYRPAEFEIAGTIAVHPDYEAEKVLAAVRTTLRSRFSFDAREFGQPVSLSEVIAAMHSIAGVAEVDVDHFQRTGPPSPVDPAPRLFAELPAGGASSNVSAAELLLLAPGNLEEIKLAT
jgi:hypothetical protein